MKKLKLPSKATIDYRNYEAYTTSSLNPDLSLGEGRTINGQLNFISRAMARQMDNVLNAYEEAHK